MHKITILNCWVISLKPKIFFFGMFMVHSDTSGEFPNLLYRQVVDAGNYYEEVRSFSQKICAENIPTENCSVIVRSVDLSEDSDRLAQEKIISCLEAKFTSDKRFCILPIRDAEIIDIVQEEVYNCIQQRVRN